VLDVIGRDRRDAWQALGDLKKEEAMFKFTELLNDSCPAFKPFVEAHITNIEMEKQQAIREELKAKEQAEMEVIHKEQMKKEEKEKEAAEERKRRIQDALNAQTFYQFKEYAEQQYPGNPEQVRWDYGL